MVIHATPGTRKLEADSFDNEGHVIEYTFEGSRDGQWAVFSSDPEPSSPTFRLTYARVDENTVDVAFAVAPPGSPGAFTAHVSGRTRRVAQRQEGPAAPRRRCRRRSRVDLPIREPGKRQPSPFSRTLGRRRCD